MELKGLLHNRRDQNCLTFRSFYSTYTIILPMGRAYTPGNLILIGLSSITLIERSHYKRHELPCYEWLTLQQIRTRFPATRKQSFLMKRLGSTPSTHLTLMERAG